MSTVFVKCLWKSIIFFCIFVYLFRVSFYFVQVFPVVYYLFALVDVLAAMMLMMMMMIILLSFVLMMCNNYGINNDGTLLECLPFWYRLNKMKFKLKRIQTCCTSILNDRVIKDCKNDKTAKCKWKLSLGMMTIWHMTDGYLNFQVIRKIHKYERGFKISMLFSVVASTITLLIANW